MLIHHGVSLREKKKYWLCVHHGGSATMSILRNIMTVLFGPSNGPQVYHEHFFE